MTRFNDTMKQAAHAVAAQDEAARKAAGIRRLAAMAARPTLSAENVVAYIDWLVANAENLGEKAVKLHMEAAELAIRTRSTDAQAKATQHTLVESGVIAPPPEAS